MTRKFGKRCVAMVVLAGTLFWLVPATAQFFDDRFPFGRRGGGSIFNPFPGIAPPQQPAPQPQRQVDYSRAPAPKKYEKNAAEELSNVVVLGDSLADHLAYGLEEAFSDSPELAVVRHARHFTSLNYNPASKRSNNIDWPSVARDTLAKENAAFVVMMIGLADRDPIREVQTAPPADQKPGTDGNADADADDADDDDAPASGKVVRHEYRSDRWVELYSRRIDDTIAAMKSKGVPVLWVGLPPIRGARSMSDMAFLNDIVRSRVERAGATYVDVWDGFVDENNRYVTQGPDFEGQVRRLRTGDGVHFTQSGARKLAHYLEKEIRRAMTPTGPVAIPIPVDPAATQPVPGAASDTALVRPLAGPVIPLNASNAAFNVDESQELAGAASPRQTLKDAVANRILNRGEPLPVPAGRADDYVWPRRAPLPVGADPVVATAMLPMTPMIAERPPQPPPAAVAAAKPGAAHPRPVRPPPGQMTPQQAQAQAQAARREAQARNPFAQTPFFFFFFR